MLCIYGILIQYVSEQNKNKSQGQYNCWCKDVMYYIVMEGIMLWIPSSATNQENSNTVSGV